MLDETIELLFQIITFAATTLGIFGFIASRDTGRLKTDSEYRNKIRNFLADKDSYAIYLRLLTRSLAFTNIWMGRYISIRSLGVIVTFSMLYSVYFFLIGWGFFGASGSIGDVEFLPDWGAWLKLSVFIWATIYILGFINLIKDGVLIDKTVDQYIQVFCRAINFRPVSDYQLALVKNLAISLVSSITILGIYETLRTGNFLFCSLVLFFLAFFFIFSTKKIPVISIPLFGAGAISLGLLFFPEYIGNNTLFFRVVGAVAISGALGLFACISLADFSIGRIAISSTSVLVLISVVIIFIELDSSLYKVPLFICTFLFLTMPALLSRGVNTKRSHVSSRAGGIIALGALFLVLGLVSDDKANESSFIWFLFFVLLPIVNAFLDWVSLGVSRFLGEHLVKEIRNRNKVLRITIVSHFIIDLVCASLILVALAFSIPLTMHLMAGAGTYLNMDIDFSISLYTDSLRGPSTADSLWMLLMFFSTLIPTTFHFFALLVAIIENNYFEKPKKRVGEWISELDKESDWDDSILGAIDRFYNYNRLFLEVCIFGGLILLSAFVFRLLQDVLIYPLADVMDYGGVFGDVLIGKIGNALVN